MCIAISFSFWFHVFIDYEHNSFEDGKMTLYNDYLERDHNKQFQKIIQCY